MPITYQILYENIINSSVNEDYKPIIEISDKLRKNIESKYKSNLFSTYSLYNNEPKNRENCYDILYDQWKIYKEMNGKKLYQKIKKSIISNLDILSMKKNIDNNCEYYEGFENINIVNINLNKSNTGGEILSSSKKENICFESNILIFMLIYDLKTIFKKRKSDNKINISEKLMKKKFPLDISSYDFKIGEKYNIDKFNSKEINKQQIEYKIIEKDNNKDNPFIKCEIFFYRSFLYFGTKEQDEDDDINKILIFKKIDIKLIETSKDYNKTNFDNCIQLKLDDGKDENIIIKFENKNIRKDFKNLINKKIMTSNNDERMLFAQYFEGLIKKYKNNEDDDDDEDF